MYSLLTEYYHHICRTQIAQREESLLENILLAKYYIASMVNVKTDPYQTALIRQVNFNAHQKKTQQKYISENALRQFIARSMLEVVCVCVCSLHYSDTV